MKKLSTSKADKIVISFILKIVISTILSILLYSYLCSSLILKFDMNLDSAKIVGIIICALCSATISFISVSKLKNNGLLMGVISTTPLIFYSLINTIFTNHNLIYFAIKFVVIVLIGALIGYIRVNKSKKFKVK